MFVLFVTTGCALTDSYEDHAREHNMLGQQVCNTLIEDVMPEDTLVRGCPTDVNTNTEGNIQSESESRKETEEAL